MRQIGPRFSQIRVSCPAGLGAVLPCNILKSKVTFGIEDPRFVPADRSPVSPRPSGNRVIQTC
jgi:hypothetical protein